MVSSHPLNDLAVLIVDDKLDNLDVAKKFLEFNGATVRSAENGEVGLKTLETFTPDVVLMDLYMPKLDGWETLQAIRGNPQWMDLPIIACTALDAYHTHEEIMADGFDGYITKPFVLETFVDDVLRVVHQTDQAGV